MGNHVTRWAAVPGCLLAFRVTRVIKHKYSCPSSLAVGTPGFCWHMVDGLELVAGRVVTEVCLCVWIYQHVWWKCMYFGHRYTNSLMTFFFLLLRCYVSSVDRVVNWPKWILIKSRYPACNVNVLPGHRIILLPRMEQLNWCNGTFVFLEGGQRYFDEPFCTRYRAVNIPILCIQAASISGQSICICSVCRWLVWSGFPQKWSNRGPRLLLHLQPTACC